MTMPMKTEPIKSPHSCIGTSASVDRGGPKGNNIQKKGPDIPQRMAVMSAGDWCWDRVLKTRLVDAQTSDAPSATPSP